MQTESIQKRPYAGGRKSPPRTPIGDALAVDPPPPLPDGERDLTVEIPEGPPLGGTARLWIETGNYGVRPMELPFPPGAEIVLGSGDAADVRVEDPTVSARHCRLCHTGTAIEVTDLGSRNGVRVGGVRVSRAALPLGGACEIGCTVVRVHPGSGAGARPPEAPPLPGMVGTSPPMRALAAAVRRIAPLRLPVLIRGESGTGKDLVAASLHEESQRRSRPFVPINAAAISRELAESELFGHKRGAFTGAVRDRRGAFREAQGGTLFLDEIGAVPVEVQVKLLRAVEEGMVRPLGAEQGIAVDTRLVAATCEPLEAMVAERTFRADLYERLAVCVIEVPALRDRPEDIPALARHLLTASDMGDRKLSPEALAALRVHRWPGNVRELRNVVVQAAVIAGGAMIEAEHVVDVLVERTSRPRRIVPGEAARIFEHVGRNVSAAARLADLPRSTMRDMLKAAGVHGCPPRK